MEDIVDFILDSPQQRDYVIDQLISSDSGYGLIGGRTGLGKTNLLLNLGACLSLGLPFFGLPTKKSRVAYLGFEGGDDNLRERGIKILCRTSFPEPGWFQRDRMGRFVLLDRGNEAKFRQLIKPFDVVLIDPIKWLLGANYTKPDAVAEFTNVFTRIMHQEKKIAIAAIQMKKRDNRVKIEPGDIFEIKGAADYVEDAAFVLLLERSELRGKNVAPELRDKYLTLHFAKHREAVKDLPSLELFYDQNQCEFKVV